MKDCMIKLNKKKLIKKDNYYSKLKEDFSNTQIKKLQVNQKKLVDYGIFKNNTSYGAYYALYKKKNFEWVKSHSEINKKKTIYIAKNLKEILLVIFNFQPKTLIDIGCGTGHITYSLKKIFKLKKILGVDPSKYAIKFASKNFKKINFKCKFLSDLKKKNEGEFDIVYLRECYPFTRNNDIKKIISNINKVSKLLSSKGLIVFENYSHLKGINVNFDLISKKLNDSFYSFKFIKFPNQLFWLYSLKMNKKFYKLLTIFIKFIYYLINRQPTFYVILSPKK